MSPPINPYESPRARGSDTEAEVPELRRNEPPYFAKLPEVGVSWLVLGWVSILFSLLLSGDIDPFDYILPFLCLMGCGFLLCGLGVLMRTRPWIVIGSGVNLLAVALLGWLSWHLAYVHGSLGAAIIIALIAALPGMILAKAVSVMLSAYRFE